MVNHDPQPKVTDPTHQDKDINLKAVCISMAALLITALLSAVAMAVLFKFYNTHMYEARQTRSPLGGLERVLPQEPLLQINEATDLAVHREYEDALLNSFTLIDKNTARIPIERAMELVNEIGFKATPAPGTGETKKAEPSKTTPEAVPAHAH